MTGAIAPTRPLTALDVCDRCGAQAYVRVLLANSGELLFCAHHGRVHAEALAKVAVDIQDESNRLSEPQPHNTRLSGQAGNEAAPSAYGADASAPKLASALSALAPCLPGAGRSRPAEASLRMTRRLRHVSAGW